MKAPNASSQNSYRRGETWGGLSWREKAGVLILAGSLIIVLATLMWLHFLRDFVADPSIGPPCEADIHGNVIYCPPDE